MNPVPLKRKKLCYERCYASTETALLVATAHTARRDCLVRVPRACRQANQNQRRVWLARFHGGIQCSAEWTAGVAARHQGRKPSLADRALPRNDRLERIFTSDQTPAGHRLQAGDQDGGQ